MTADTVVAPLLTVAPTRRELGGLGDGNPSTRANVVGVGRVAGERVAELLDAAPVSLLVSLGYAGALAPDLHTGDVVVVNSYLYGADAPVPADPQATGAATRLREAGLSVLEGPVLAVDEPLLSPQAKRCAHHGSGALVVDMEGRWIANAAAMRSVPLIGIRAVLDEACYPLPSFVATIVADAGRREWVHVGRAMSDPSALRSLLPLALKSRDASRALRQAVAIILPALADEL